MKVRFMNQRRLARRPGRDRTAKASGKAGRWRLLAVSTVIALVAAGASGSAAGAAGQPGAPGAAGPHYQATIVRTAFGIPHITAATFGSLGYGYGFAVASDNICTLAMSYVTVEGQRSRYFGANKPDPPNGYTNLQSDLFWRSVIARHVIPRLLKIRTGPGAIGPQLRRLSRGYVAGYNAYLASVGGSAGVSDPTCRGQAWVKPITTLDAYLLIYQDLDQSGQVALIPSIVNAHPPAASVATAGRNDPLGAYAAAVLRTAPGTAGLPSVRQLRKLGDQFAAPSRSGGLGSNAIAIGSADTRDHRRGILLGNPHFPWQGADRFYQVQLTIPGRMNVEGATLLGFPQVIIGFTASMAWSLTVSPAWTVVPYQLALVPGHPTQYVFNGKPVSMIRQLVTVETTSADGKINLIHRTLWSTRYGPVISSFQGQALPWTTTTAFALTDANAGNLRILNHFLATDQARSVAGELSILKRYEGLPFVNTTAADSSGHALYADIQATPDVTDAEAARCDTPIGRIFFALGGPPVLDGSRSSCALGTDRDSAVPGIFGSAEQPRLMTRTFVENSNDSYWMTNPAHPLTGFPRIIGGAGTGNVGTQGGDLGLRTRSALNMIMKRISGSDGLGPPGFTLADMKNLMFSDIQYGASLVRRQTVTMCRSFPGGLAPTSAGGTIPVGDSCQVLAHWNGRENVQSRGAVLFRAFWENALFLPVGPWAHPFNPANPLGTPNGLATARAGVQQAFGDALASLQAAKLPYDVALGTVQYVLRNGTKIPLPGGPGDPDGEFNAIQVVQNGPAAGAAEGSSYIQAVTWTSGQCRARAATLVTYSESVNPASPHYADQTELFSHRRWATAYFCPSQVAAHALSTTVLRGG